MEKIITTINRIVKYGDIGSGGNKFILENSGATNKIIRETINLIKWLV